MNNNFNLDKLGKAITLKKEKKISILFFPEGEYGNFEKKIFSRN
jgi:hypothetical protein